jgi:hypothetical protein
MKILLDGIISKADTEVYISELEDVHGPESTKLDREKK